MFTKSCDSQNNCVTSEISGNLVAEIKKEEEFEDIIEASEEGTEFDDEIEDILKDQELTQSIFSDDDPADMSDLEKQEKGFE